MLNFDNFWAKDAPEAEENAASLSGIDPRLAALMQKQFDEVSQKRPGVTADEIARWEKRNGVRLPDSLRTALTLQNGGMLADSPVSVHQLSEIRRTDAEFWGYATLDDEDDDAANDFQRGFFLLAEDMELGGVYLLNFNENGPKGEPSVYQYYSDPGDVSRVSPSLTAFFTSILAADVSPAVDWSETEKAPVIFHEKIDLTPLYHVPSFVRQVLCKREQALVLFKHTKDPDSERMTQTTLPLPIRKKNMSVQRLRPGDHGTFALHLEPKATDEIRFVESTKTESGLWKNSKSAGVPIYDYVESKASSRLKELRTKLIGEKSAKEADLADKKDADFQKTLTSLPPDQQSSAFMELFLGSKDMLSSLDDLSLEPSSTIPFELGGDFDLASAQRRIQEQLQDALAKARKLTAKTPLPDEVKKLLNDHLQSATEKYDNDEDE